MNVAIIFAGGIGSRMGNTAIPKQFLCLNEKPVLAYTLEKFQNHSEVDAIILVVLREWIDFCCNMKKEYSFGKIASIIPGGKTGQESIYFGIKKAAELFGEDALLLIHDGVRPLVSSKEISDAVHCAEKYGNAVPVTLATNTIVLSQSNTIASIMDRNKCFLATAPQCYYAHDILPLHEQAKAEKRQFIDSACLMNYYGKELYTVESSPLNIKITTESDFYMFKAYLEMKSHE